MKAVSVSEVQKNSAILRSSVRQPNGQRCKHPRSMRFNDLENGETCCRSCGEVLREKVGPVSLVGGEKHGRAPTNDSLFKRNLGTTSKFNPDQRGPEPYHLHALATVYGGSHGHLGSLTQTRSCPICRTQQPVKLFNDGGLVCENETCGSLVCGKCSSLKVKDENGEITDGDGGDLRCSFGPSVREDLVCSKYGEIRKHVKFMRSHLGDYILRWNPSNDGNSLRLAFWSDLRTLQSWDPPENDPNVKAARELLKEKLLSRVSPEDAHRLATKYLQGVKKISRIPRKTLVNLLDSVIESEQMTIEN